MGWSSGSTLADDIWKELKPILNKKEQKQISKFLYNKFCEYDADDWSWWEGALEYDAYKMNNPKEWKRLDEESR